MIIIIELIIAMLIIIHFRHECRDRKLHHITNHCHRVTIVILIIIHFRDECRDGNLHDVKDDNNH